MSAHQVDPKDGTRIRYKRVREDNGEEIAFGDIANAYLSDTGQTVILTKSDLDVLPAEQSREIEISDFVPADQVDPIMFDKTYYLEPASKSIKAYELLRQALSDTDRLAICAFTLRSKTRLAALRVYNNVITLQTLLWPDEVRTAAFPSLEQPETKLRPQELAMASQLIESMSDDFEPSKYTDSYAEELHKLIEAKAEGGEAFEPPDTVVKQPDDDSEVADLLAALRSSVQSRSHEVAENDSSEDDEPADDSDEDEEKASRQSKAPAQRSAKKAAAKKAQPKKKAS